LKYLLIEILHILPIGKQTIEKGTQRDSTCLIESPKLVFALRVLEERSGWIETPKLVIEPRSGSGAREYLSELAVS
jgi:hypothetical protein